MLAVNHQLAALDMDITLELAVCGIVLEHVDPIVGISSSLSGIGGASVHVLKVDERIVDGLDGNVVVEQGISKHLSDKKCQTGGQISGKTYNAPDTAESVDSDIDDHVVGIKMMNWPDWNGKARWQRRDDGAIRGTVFGAVVGFVG